MAMNPEVRERIRSGIASHCVAIVAACVPGAVVTVIVRNPSVQGDADVIVSTDTKSEILSAIERRFP